MFQFSYTENTVCLVTNRLDSWVSDTTSGSDLHFIFIWCETGLFISCQCLLTETATKHASCAVLCCAVHRERKPINQNCWCIVLLWLLYAHIEVYVLYYTSSFLLLEGILLNRKAYDVHQIAKQASRLILLMLELDVVGEHISDLGFILFM